MGIPLNEPGGSPGYPVLKRRGIGEAFTGGLVHLDQRQSQRDGQPQFKENGNPRYELVVTLQTVESSMVAGSGETESIPAPGDLVRLILKGGGFGDWIEARNTFVAANRPIEVGDLVQVTTTHAIRYESMGNHRALGEIHSQPELDAYYQAMVGPAARQESLGFRGGLVIVAAPPNFAAVVAQCEEHHKRLTTEGIQAEAPTPAIPAPPAQVPAPMPVPTPVATAPAEGTVPMPPPIQVPAAPAEAAPSLGDLFGN